MIRAGGGVLWRCTDDGDLEVAVIHRPRYDDWTLPKGKLMRGEGELEAAVREVSEETGQRVRPGPAIGEIRYRQVRKGEEHDKVVRYWAMEALGGDFRPSDEVDEVRWLAPSSALPLLTYQRDRDIFQQFLSLERHGMTAGD